MEYHEECAVRNGAVISSWSACPPACYFIRSVRYERAAIRAHAAPGMRGMFAAPGAGVVLRRPRCLCAAPTRRRSCDVMLRRQRR